MKTGRNAHCPCGSGKKFKRCCIEARVSSLGGALPDLAEIRRILAEKQRADAQRIATFGHVRAPVTSRLNGRVFVAVGDRLLTDERWKTFHDFLFTYLGSVIEQDWFRTEVAKPVAQRHPLMQWYQILDELGTWRNHPRGETRMVSSPPALVSALLSFCYELYTLDNYGLLTKRLVSRLKRADQFQGARYEVYVASACLRAGFDVELEDEDDRTASHCEFTVTHRASGRKYSVEAKSRQRTGYLGVAGKRVPPEEIEASVSGLLVPALRKAARYERLVFIDINVPPDESPLLEAEWFNKIAYQVERLETKPPQGQPLPAGIVFFTNFPHHFIEGDEALRGQSVGFTGLGLPEFRGANRDENLIETKHAPILALFDSMLRHTAVPHELN